MVQDKAARRFSGMRLLLDAVNLALVYFGVYVVRRINPVTLQVPSNQWYKYSYPFMIETKVSPVMLITICSVVPLCIVSIMLGVSRLCLKWSVYRILSEAKTAFFSVSLACAWTGLFVNVIKIWFGRPRPDFLNRCFSAQFSSLNFSAIPRIPRCTNHNLDVVLDGRRSFPSGHAAYTWAAIMWCSVYCFCKLSTFGWALGSLTYSLPTALLLVPLWVSIGRVSDYRHHPEDVLFGALLGATIGMLAHYFHFRAVQSEDGAMKRLLQCDGDDGDGHDDAVDVRFPCRGSSRDLIVDVHGDYVGARMCPHYTNTPNHDNF